MKKRIIEIAVKVVVAALTAFLTAITTTSCMGYGPLPKIVQISLTKNPLAENLRGEFFVLEQKPCKAYDTSMALVTFCFGSVFGMVTVRMPSSTLAEI